MPSGCSFYEKRFSSLDITPKGQTPSAVHIISAESRFRFYSSNIPNFLKRS